MSKQWIKVPSKIKKGGGQQKDDWGRSRSGGINKSETNSSGQKPTWESNIKFLSTFKTTACRDEVNHIFHDHRLCPHYHSRKKDFRRNPFTEFYDLTEAKSDVELLYHPARFRTILCTDPNTCPFGVLCAKAHHEQELIDEDAASFKYVVRMTMQPETHSAPTISSFITAGSGKEINKKKTESKIWAKETQVDKEFSSCMKHTVEKGSTEWFMIISSKEFRHYLKNIAFEEGLCRLILQRNSWDPNHSPLLVIQGYDVQTAMNRVLQALKCPPKIFFSFQSVDYISDRVMIKLRSAIGRGELIPPRFENMIHITPQESKVTACARREEMSHSALATVFDKIDFWVKQEEYDKFFECCCCLTERNPDEGIKCSCEMFMCSTGGCFDRFIESQIPQLQGQDSNVLCPSCKAELPAINVARHVSRDIWERLQGAVLDNKVKAKYEKLQSSFDKRLEEKMNDLIAKYDTVQDFVKEKAKLIAARARNEALNLKCPHCDTVYAEFDGCMALKCSTCNENFCGYCHVPVKTSRGAHEHVRSCLMNETKNGSYYATKEEVIQAQRRYRTREIKKFLQQFKKQEQNATIIELTEDLDDLGIDPASLFEFGADLRVQDQEYI